ncbi:hypothetical protein M758_5G039700 [Ceratodon purpureus]|uniref:Uncharacterized protein n=1 Tax=Ceratodon purpureus TaxID=3225 RepID=A0A8T0HYG6_CERPU|nr:hypothetical protein KC19_5G039700 [Ceratodon purpureus]KAG0615418.1 hypothetical protein M758_5G039700 [Ceratodon purpureus]
MPVVKAISILQHPPIHVSTPLRSYINRPLINISLKFSVVALSLEPGEQNTSVGERLQ